MGPSEVSRCWSLIQLISAVSVGLTRASTASASTGSSFSCEAFSPSGPRGPLPVGCQWKYDDSRSCIVTSMDLQCGLGRRLILLDKTTCDGKETTIGDCCVPCQRAVIMDPNCKAQYCQHGRLSDGQLYDLDDCYYRAGSWSECHSSLLLQTRMDFLYADSPSHSCAKHNNLTRLCKFGGETPKTIISEDSDEEECRYEDTEWSTCDHKEKKRERTMRKIRGPPSCELVKHEYKECFTKPGRERCFYSNWGRWSPCTNMQQQRVRKVLFGNTKDCDRTHKVRICDLKTSQASTTAVTKRESALNPTTNANRKGHRRKLRHSHTYISRSAVS